MNTTSPIHVGAVLFEGFELLDFYGPLEMFGLLEAAARITIVAEKYRRRQKQSRSLWHGRGNDGGFGRL